MAIKTISRSFSDMKINVGNNIQDTSAATASIIGKYLNDKYEDAWNRTQWSSTVNDNFTFESVIGQAEYNLPIDFSYEIFVANIAQGFPIRRMTIGQWWKERNTAHFEDSISNGTARRYIILEEAVRTDEVGFGKIKLDPPPDTAETFAMPYHRRFTRMLNVTGTVTTDTENKIIASASTFLTSKVEAGMIVNNTTDNTYGIIASVDTQTQLTMETDLCPDGNETFTITNEMIIPNLGWILELGATGETWMKKRQFQKADFSLGRYAIELDKRIHLEKSNPNQTYQFIPESADINPVHRFTGDTSYDSL